jgi:metal-responsive CopG/Arc/MetJ family transcriptional regulator
MGKTASFTLDEELLNYVARTRRDHSRSQRVNELLRRGIEQERQAQLEAEAAAFFRASPRAERTESRAFHAAGRKSLARD